MEGKVKKPEGFTLVLGGEAGQGIQFIETVLVNVVKENGYNVFATKEYMSRIRGGVNTTEIRISSTRVQAHCDTIDLLIPLKEEVLSHLGTRISKQTLIIGDKTVINNDMVIDVPFSEIASRLGNRIYSNSVALGVICGILDIGKNSLAAQIKERFISKGQTIVDKNIQASEKGYAMGKTVLKEKNLLIEIDRSEPVTRELLLTGADAIALGALAGGCNAAFAYPMTPSTSLFTLMAGFSKETDILVEQVEDEIGAVNMALGAWYAGARAIVSTSGGGFALMTEGISLSGMTETPIVVHLAQRPGPATGLPTRTEQGDLNLVLYAGHGEFPRIILAPGTIQQGFDLAGKAFNMADKFQVPVFILSDQYYVDSYYNIPVFDIDSIEITPCFEKTTDDYKRYRLTRDGISMRGIPGYGSGRVCVDSDEHDESGRITEDLDGVRIPMADKRAGKMALIQQAALEPELVGDPDYQTLIIGWGSTCTIITEAMECLGHDKTAFLFCPQLYPLHESVKTYLESARTIISVENNQIGQFSDLITKETGVRINTRILKYNGMPFSVEELIMKIGGAL